MKTNIPNDEGRKRLQDMGKFYHHLPIYVLCLGSFSLLVKIVLDHYPILGVALTLLILVGTIYLGLNVTLLKKCPRCSSWGTPIVGGNCPRCGLHLDPSYNEGKKHTTNQ